jgi:hypothetical protein
MELYEANAQWANRPDDERFESLAAMEAACAQHAKLAREAHIPLGTLRVEAEDGAISLVGKTGVPATLTHYGFGQLSRMANAPPSYLRELPATLAGQCLNNGLARLTRERGAETRINVLFHQNGSLKARAITSESYDRVWDWLVCRKLRENLDGSFWRAPPARPAREGQRGTRPATAADILPNQGDFGLRIKVGDPIAPAGLYASDHDMFAFLVNTQEPVWNGDKFMHRGMFAWNSEVGDRSLGAMFFLMDHVCGNHIVWGASKVTRVSVRHVKGRHSYSAGNTLRTASQKWRMMVQELPGPEEMGRQIQMAKEREIGATKEEVLDALFSFARKKSLQLLTKGRIEAAYQLTEHTPRYGSPYSVWGLVNGLTELSQSEFAGQTDNRTEMDMQAGRVMEMAF